MSGHNESASGQTPAGEVGREEEMAPAQQTVSHESKNASRLSARATDDKISAPEKALYFLTNGRWDSTVGRRVPAWEEGAFEDRNHETLLS